MNSRTSMLALAAAALLVASPACKDKRRAKLGSVCASDDSCASGFCYAATCLDPGADNDGDGLINELEKELATDPILADSDRDGVNDKDEVGSEISNPGDADADGRHDALESRTTDKDKDCIPDQFDPDDGDIEIDDDVVAKLACRSEGVCGDPEAIVTASCGAGAVLTCDYSKVPAYEPDVETLCDGRDNDCDGTVDELLGYLDVDGDVKLVGGPCGGIGACEGQEGVVECDAFGDTTCSVNAGGSAPGGLEAEIPCNNVDDDCNGATDDGTLWVDPVSGDEKAYGSPCTGLGVCGLTTGSVECDAETGEAVCSVEPGGSEDLSADETCDGEDNDCDGDVDEALVYVSPDGSELALGAACGQGVCFGGEVACGEDGVATCSTADEAELDGKEHCNGLDDDCDGETDELEGLALNCLQEGVCATIQPSNVQCLENGTVACFYLGVEGYEHDQEVSCNGLDDDCDGETDEGLTAPDGTELGEPCMGTGACAGLTGTVVCPPAELVDESPGAVCSADLTDASELCDGVDNDCDGVTDEDPEDAPGGEVACSTEGVCASWSEVPPVCDAGEWVCAYVEGVGYEPVELSCDNADNDCDGVVDEDTPKYFTATLAALEEAQPAARQRWPVARPDEGDPVLFGGLQVSADGSKARVLGDTWRYDTAAARWSPVPASNGPAPRAMHAMAWEPGVGRVLVHGGLSAAGLPALTDEYGTRLDDMWAFDPDTDTWSEVTQNGLPFDEDHARSHHVLVSLGAGKVLLHGGLRDAGLATLVGTVAEGLGGNVTVSWDDATAQAPERVAHAAVWSEELGMVALVGGVAAAAVPFAQVWDGDSAAWQTIGADTEPPARSFPAVAVTGDKLVVAGGSGDDDLWGVGGAQSADAWVYAVDTAKWQSLDSGSLQALSGAAAWSTEDGSVFLAGGASVAVGAAARQTWSLEQAAWTAPDAWAGPPPRVGAAAATRPDTGDLVLIGGTRQVVAYPLQDAWWFEAETATWSPIVASASAKATSYDLTRPATVGASATWDPVGGRFLVFGGVEPGEETPSAQLWSLDVGDDPGFDAASSQGDAPPGALRPLFGVAPGGSTATLVGLFDGELRVYELALANLEWTMAWSPSDGGGPTDVMGLAGGVGEPGVRAIVRRSDGFPEVWTFAGGEWTDDTVTTGAVPYDEFHTWAYHPVSDRTLVLAPSAIDGALFVLQYGHQNKTFGLLQGVGSWPDHVAGSAFAVHPTEGGLVFGGALEGLFGTASWFAIAQSCTP